MSSGYMLDGKPVRKFLFHRFTSIAHNGAIPVDRKQRAKMFDEHDMSKQKFIVNVQVEGFDKDHALKRLAELYPMVARKEWEFNMELDAEHDIGLLGASHPLNPAFVHPSHRRIQ